MTARESKSARETTREQARDAKRGTQRLAYRLSLCLSLFRARARARAFSRSVSFSSSLFLFPTLTLSRSHKERLTERQSETAQDSKSARETTRAHAQITDSLARSRFLWLPLTFSRCPSSHHPPPIYCSTAHIFGNGFGIHTNTGLFPVEYRARFDKRDQNIYESGCTRERARSHFL